MKTHGAWSLYNYWSAELDKRNIKHSGTARKVDEIEKKRQKKKKGIK